jgi:hypothetical protein
MSGDARIELQAGCSKIVNASFWLGLCCSGVGSVVWSKARDSSEMPRSPEGICAREIQRCSPFPFFRGQESLKTGLFVALILHVLEPLLMLLLGMKVKELVRQYLLLVHVNTAYTETRHNNRG